MEMYAQREKDTLARLISVLCTTNSTLQSQAGYQTQFENQHKRLYLLMITLVYINHMQHQVYKHQLVNNTLRIQLIATAPGADRFLETPTEFKSVCVVKTPIAPPKKCYRVVITSAFGVYGSKKLTA